MKTHFLTFICCFVVVTILRAQDSLVRYEDVRFNSTFEKKVLDDHFKEHKTDHFLLLMANGKGLNDQAINQAKEKFFNHLNALRSKLATRKNDKKIKLLYEDIHQSFLAKYEVNNRFEDIFSLGYYNCVSSSGLYGIAFHYLDIPFTIKEKPTHVYLIAYPDHEKLIVETTAPVGGFLAINQQFKQHFVKILKDQKIISAQEFASNTVNTLFERYYFGEQGDITLLQLVGLQYLNDGLLQLEMEKHLDALCQFEKAYLFYPSDRVAYMIMFSAYEAFQKKEKKDPDHASYLAKLSRFKKYGIRQDMILGEFSRVIQLLLFEKGEKEKLKEYFTTLDSLIQDTELRNEIRFMYHYESGRLLYNQARYKDCVPFFEEALKVKPNHLDASSILINSLTQSLRSLNNTEVIKTLQKYLASYPSLLQNNIFNELLANAYLVEFRNSYDLGNSGEGDKYKNIFEIFYKEHPDLSINDYWLGQAYSAAAVYYFKKGQTGKARNLIAQGLQLSPDNYELKMRKRMIN